MIDFPALFRTLIEIGYQGQVGLEYQINAKDPLPGHDRVDGVHARRARGADDDNLASAARRG